MFYLFFSRLFSLPAKQWSFATSTLFRLSWSTTGWLSRLRRLQNKKLRSRYSLLLTQVHCIAQYYSPTSSLYCSPITFDPPTPSLQQTPHHRHKNSQEEKNIVWENLTLNPVVDSPTCGFNCRPCVLPIRSLGLCNSTCILHNGLIRRVSFLFLTSVEIIFQRSLLKQIGLVNMSEYCST